MATLIMLIEKYGYQLALTGLLGVIIIEVLKVPMNKLLIKRFPKIIADAEKFDIVAFLLSFIIASLLAVSYSLIISYTNILSIVDGDGNYISTILPIVGYLTNILATWMFQLLFYSIYKKLGIKRLIKILLGSAKKSMDTNKNGKIELMEAIAKIQSLLVNNKLSKERIATLAEEITKNTVETITEEAGTSATINEQAEVIEIKNKVDKAITKIPSKEVKHLAELAASKLEETATQIVTSNPTKPIIKF